MRRTLRSMRLAAGAVVEVAVVEVEALGGEPRVLEHVPARAALLQRELARLALEQVVAVDLHRQVGRRRTTGSRPAGLEEAVDAVGQQLLVPRAGARRADRLLGAAGRWPGPAGQLDGPTTSRRGTAPGMSRGVAAGAAGGDQRLGDPGDRGGDRPRPPAAGGAGQEGEVGDLAAITAPVALQDASRSSTGRCGVARGASGGARAPGRWCGGVALEVAEQVGHLRRVAAPRTGRPGRGRPRRRRRDRLQRAARRLAMASPRKVVGSTNRMTAEQPLDRQVGGARGRRRRGPRAGRRRWRPGGGVVDRDPGGGDEAVAGGRLSAESASTSSASTAPRRSRPSRTTAAVKVGQSQRIGPPEASHDGIAVPAVTGAGTRDPHGPPSSPQMSAT